jgi:hypothetical protein
VFRTWQQLAQLVHPTRPLPLPLPSHALQKGSQWWGTFDFDSEPFDWGSEYEQPGHQLKDLVIYEMSVRCFTAAESSGVPPERQGTYLGVVDKVGVAGEGMKWRGGSERQAAGETGCLSVRLLWRPGAVHAGSPPVLRPAPLPRSRRYPTCSPLA